jgi:streptothricin acetyltransferase
MRIAWRLVRIQYQVAMILVRQKGAFPMNLVIQELDELNIEDVGKCDGEFVIDSQLILHVENNQIRYTVIDRPATKKRYEQKDVDYTAYIGSSDRTVFLGYVDGKVAGQIVLRKNWNEYACVDYIAVDVGFRRHGIGYALISRAKRWAQERQLPGIIAETQNNNLQACNFYEACGFKLGGFDSYLYRGIDAGTDEIALYWYLYFEREAK